MESYYEILKVSPFFTTGELKRAFRCLAKRYHPDVLQTGNREKYESIRAAYEVLLERVSREDYDQRLREAVVPQEKEIDTATKIEIILAWSTTNPKSDPSIANSFANRMAEGKPLTPKQSATIDNIIRGFRIPVDEWLDSTKRDIALEEYFEKQNSFKAFEEIK